MKGRVLAKLSKEAFVSGQKIANDLGISRTSVFKHIKALEEVGFVISSVTKHGYKLLEEPDKLHPLVIDKYSKTDFVGRRILHFEEVDSTIEIAMQKAKKAEEGLVVVAEKQLCGRGRFRKAWQSPKGGIWASLLLKPKCAPAEAASLNIITSLAIAEAIEEVVKIDTYIKWPNDILVGARFTSPMKKVAGILTEMNAELDKINYAIVSFGVNVNNRIPAELQDLATSLRHVGVRHAVPLPRIDRQALFCLILQKLENYYVQWQKEGIELILDKLRKRCSTLGKFVEVKGLNGVLKGEALDVDESGRLILKTSDGKKHYLSSGEVSILPCTH